MTKPIQALSPVKSLKHIRRFSKAAEDEIKKHNTDAKTYRSRIIIQTYANSQALIYGLDIGQKDKNGKPVSFLLLIDNLNQKTEKTDIAKEVMAEASQISLLVEQHQSNFFKQNQYDALISFPTGTKKLLIHAYKDQQLIDKTPKGGWSSDPMKRRKQLKALNNQQKKTANVYEKRLYADTIELEPQPTISLNLKQSRKELEKQSKQQTL